jgi:hypothetical protein
LQAIAVDYDRMKKQINKKDIDCFRNLGKFEELS